VVQINACSDISLPTFLAQSTTFPPATLDRSTIQPSHTSSIRTVQTTHAAPARWSRCLHGPDSDVMSLTDCTRLRTGERNKKERLWSSPWNCKIYFLSFSIRRRDISVSVVNKLQATSVRFPVGQFLLTRCPDWLWGHRNKYYILLMPKWAIVHLIMMASY
jgi:hypothetical protein